MKKQCWIVKNTSWPTKFIKNIISVSVQTDKKRKKKRKKNYFLHTLLVVGLKQTPIATNTVINKSSPLENYKAKRWPRTRDHNYFTVFMQFQLYLFFSMPN